MTTLADLTPYSSIEEIEKALWNTARNLAKTWRMAQAANPFDAFYIYYRESGIGRCGEVIVSSNPPSEEHRLASPERIMHHLTQDQVARKIFETMKKLPILPIVE